MNNSLIYKNLRRKKSIYLAFFIPVQIVCTIRQQEITNYHYKRAVKDSIHEHRKKIKNLKISKKYSKIRQFFVHQCGTI